MQRKKDRVTRFIWVDGTIGDIFFSICQIVFNVIVYFEILKET